MLHRFRRIYELRWGRYPDPVAEFRALALRKLSLASSILCALALLVVGPTACRQTLMTVVIGVVLFAAAGQGQRVMRALGWLLVPLLIGYMTWEAHGSQQGVLNPGMSLALGAAQVAGLMLGSQGMWYCGALNAVAVAALLRFSLQRFAAGLPFPMHDSALIGVAVCLVWNVFSFGLVFYFWEREVHKRLRAERDAQRVAQEREQFLRIVTHELRAPLSQLQMSVQLLERGAPTELGRRMQRSIKRMDGLMGDLLDVARIDAGTLRLDPRPLDLRELCIEVADEVTLASDREVELQLDAVELRADPRRIAQVLTNLLTNAIKYAPAPTPVGLTLRALPDEAVLEVRDQGPGIAREQQRLIFERYARLGADGGRAGGVGLGLYICKVLVEAHGGRITVHSEPDAGTTFAVHLPRHPTGD